MRLLRNLVQRSTPSLDKHAPAAYLSVMKELLRTTDPTVIAFAQALLQGEGINSFPMDVHMSILEGGIGIFPRRLLVRQQDHFLAAKVMDDNDIPRTP